MCKEWQVQGRLDELNFREKQVFQEWADFLAGEAPGSWHKKMEGVLPELWRLWRTAGLS